MVFLSVIRVEPEEQLKLVEDSDPPDDVTVLYGYASQTRQRSEFSEKDLPGQHFPSVVTSLFPDICESCTPGRDYHSIYV